MEIVSECKTVEAVAYWLSRGTTSSRNPVHAVALRKIIHPFGVTCDYLLCDPIGTDNQWDGFPELHDPHWESTRADGKILPLFESALRANIGQIRLGQDLMFRVYRGKDVIPLPAGVSLDEANNLWLKARSATTRFILRVFHTIAKDEGAAAQFLSDPTRYVEEFYDELAAGARQKV